MRQTSIQPALLHFFAIVLMVLGTVSAHAQYYMNIRQTDSTRVRFALSAVDSVWFDTDEQQEPSVNYEYVDLGLSVKWATFNVGATKPEEYGDYFAWGETEPYYENGFAQEDPQAHWKESYTAGYGWSTYKYCYGGSYTNMTKYCSDSEYGYNGFTDTKTTLEPDDDVAHVNWGGDWRMPTYTEIEELCNGDNCTWVWTTQNGVNGYLVTSKKTGYEGAFIFLPAAGERYGVRLDYFGSRANYWSSSLYTDCPHFAQDFHFSSDGLWVFYSYRLYGKSVRPVCP